jgi:diguanylate cyclase (GGDEF)-like protein
MNYPWRDKQKEAPVKLPSVDSLGSPKERFWSHIALAILLLGSLQIVATAWWFRGQQAEGLILSQLIGSGLIISALLLRRIPNRTSWLLLAAGTVGVNVADHLETNINLVWFSFSDLLFVVSYIIIICGILSISHYRPKGLYQPALIDAGITIIGFGLFLILFVLPIQAAGQIITPLLFLKSGFYYLLDFSLLGLSLRLFFSNAKHSPALYLLLAGAFCFFFSHFLNFTVIAGSGGLLGEVEYLRSAAYLFWVAACLHGTSAYIVEETPEDALALSPLRLGLIIGVLFASAALLVALNFRAIDLANPLVILLWAAVCGLISLRLIGALANLKKLLQEQRVLKEAVTHQAQHDPLTGLANRNLFSGQLDNVIKVDPRHSAVLFMDIDDFKSINDTLGHPVGDEVIKIVAARLTSVVRNQDLVARLGGDEFAIILRNLDQASIDSLVARIFEIFNQRFAINELSLEIKVSMGVALIGPEQTGALILQRADIAMYLVKGQGGNGYEIFEEGRHNQVVEQLKLRAELSRALDNQELVMYYQPIFELANARTCGAEALVRWQHPQKGLLTMAQFKSLAEETGLIVPIGRWALQKACQQASRWARSEDPYLLPVAVNLSAAQLSSDRIVADVKAALAQNDLAPQSLVLDISEGGIANEEEIAHNILELKKLGVKLALDNFGSGGASLISLSELPFDFVKIDPSVIQQEDAARRRGLLEEIARLAQRLNIVPVAEGIESAEQAEFLRSLGYVLGQGYAYMAPDVPANVVQLTKKAA